MSDERELVQKTKEFATESRAKSVTVTVTTLAILAGVIAVALRVPVAPGAFGWALRGAASVIGGLLIVRTFILFHDFWHGAILRRSRAARLLFWTIGILLMTPARVWRDTHNYHHAHTAKIVGSNIGSYMMVTTSMWAKMTGSQRLMYRMIRHPLTIAFGYFTIFMLGMCVMPLMRAPKKNSSAGVALLVNWTITALMIWKLGLAAWVFAYFLPLAIAMAVGAYLFYAQHNFPDMVVQPRESWSFTRAAIESSSYMEMGPLMAYFTGNIGFHHVHHLNPLIPFYRLPEAQAGVPELQAAHKTSLRAGDIARCFAQKLWDQDTGHMVGYPKA
jgi:omega-6 fatty acid desaturase (delta-12 desaturase)